MVRSESNISLDYKDPHSHYDLPPPYSPPSTSTPAPEKSIPDEFLEYKEDDLAALRDYDTVIIVDDSKSMKAVWNEACKALAELAVTASKYDTNGIEIQFLNRGVVKDPVSKLPKLKLPRFFKGKGKDKGHGTKYTSKREVEQLFETVQPDGDLSNIGSYLEDETRKLVIRLGNGEDVKKTNYLVITDGIPSDGLEESIVAITKKLETVGAVSCQVGIQFIQMGNAPGVRNFLINLDNDLRTMGATRDIVDTERFECPGLTTTQRMVKILVGAINRKVDNGSLPQTTPKA